MVQGSPEEDDVEPQAPPQGEEETRPGHAFKGPMIDHVGTFKGPMIDYLGAFIGPYV